MNIDIINNQSVDRSMDIDKKEHSNSSSFDSRMKTKNVGYSLDISGKVMENAAYGKEELKSVQEVAQAAGMQNVTLNRNYMAVMSNSMSDEDFAKLLKDGVNPANTSVSDSVTNLDKIKIKMAEAGVTIAGYNDDISAEDIQSVVGSAGLAQDIIKNSNAEYSVDVADIESSLQKKDLPDTKENIEAMQAAFETAQGLMPLTDDAVKYMLTNELRPTIENIYKAEFSSVADYHSNNIAKRYDGIGTYAGSSDSINAWDELENQAIKVVESAGIDLEEGIEAAKWLVENQIPLTTDNLLEYNELKQIDFPIDSDDLLDSMTVAIQEGIEPVKADVTKTESLYEKAVKFVEEFARMDDGGDITRRRQLEEIRLVMTAEANLTLLRKGIQIDTQPLETLVELLKEAEREFYTPLLESNNDFADSESGSVNVADDYSIDDKIDLYKSVRQVIDNIPSIPVSAITDVNPFIETRLDDFTLEELHSAGIARQDAYNRANESYEALMTAPRADMGDSIRKAFNNVDDILADLGLDINEKNQKAVRTLGYAQMPVTRESVENIREVTNTVERVIEMMTPARTLKLIREGYNPLNESIYDLEKTLSNESIEEVNEKYSQYLWNLEKNGDITEDEKAAYIGMYRLFNLIEKQDGKVIGNVLSNGQELTMQNMLSASRSNRHKNMDVKIDDDFGLLDELIEKGDSISEQISQGFAKLMSDPISKDYAKERMEEVRKSLRLADSTENILDILDEPVTAENIAALSDMMPGGAKSFRKLFNNEPDSNDIYNSEDEYISEEEVKELISDFTDSESAQKAYGRFCEKAVEIASNNIRSSQSYDDIRQWMLINKQISLMGDMSRSRAYEIPLKTEDGYTSVHLTIKQSANESGNVVASFETMEYGRVEAKFTLGELGINGFIVSDSRAGVSAINSIEDKLREAFSQEGMETNNMSVVFSGQHSVEEYIPSDNGIDVTNRQLYSIAKAFITTLEDN